MLLKDKVAIVTGSGKGIGEGIARVLAREGARVVVCARSRDDITRVAGEIEAAGGQAAPVAVDVTKKDQIEALVRETLARFGTIDVLVNNAGTELPPALVQDIPEEQWDYILAVNLKGAFLCCQAVIPTLIEKRSGKIINIGSLAARRMSFFGSADYTASKYGLAGLTHHLAHEMAMYGVTVNMVNPGATLTPLAEGRSTKEYRDAVEKMIPLGRWGVPQDVGEAVAFLASSGASQMTGQSLDLDGGILLGYETTYQQVMDQKMKRIAAMRAAGGAQH